jgi:hypothetical protein
VRIPSEKHRDMGYVLDSHGESGIVTGEQRDAVDGGLGY